MEGEWDETHLGSLVCVPWGTGHTFRNLGKEQLKMLMGISPAGIEAFFSRCAEEFDQPDLPEMDQIATIGAEFGIQFVG